MGNGQSSPIANKAQYSIPVRVPSTTKDGNAPTFALPQDHVAQQDDSSRKSTVGDNVEDSSSQIGTNNRTRVKLEDSEDHMSDSQPIANNTLTAAMPDLSLRRSPGSITENHQFKTLTEEGSSTHDRKTVVGVTANTALDKPYAIGQAIPTRKPTNVAYEQKATVNRGSYEFPKAGNVPVPLSPSTSAISGPRRGARDSPIGRGIGRGAVQGINHHTNSTKNTMEGQRSELNVRGKLGRPRASRGSTRGRPRGARAGLLGATCRSLAQRKRKRDEFDDEADLTPSESSETSEADTDEIADIGVAVNTPSKSTEKSPTKPQTSRLGNNSVLRSKRPPFAKGRALSTQSSVTCQQCRRGPSPITNQIVFCDGCDTPWHQFCHDPPIDQSVTRVLESQWYCSDCKIFQRLRTSLRYHVSGAEVLSRTGLEMTLKRQKNFFSSLKPDTLISMLLYASLESPHLNLFDPLAPIPQQSPTWDIPQQRQQQTLDGEPRPSSKNVPQAPANASVDKDEDGRPIVEETYDDLYEEPLPYPRMGHGLVGTRLYNPVSETYLIDDNRDNAISHSCRAKNDSGQGTKAAPVLIN